MPDPEQLRLSSTSYVVLGLLSSFGPATPYMLKGMLERSIENFWPVPHTTFYAEPARLAAGGFLSESQETGGRRRKLYAPTARGSEALSAWLTDERSDPPQVRDDVFLKIFCGADPAPLLQRRLHWHREKLAELEGYLQAMGDGGPLSGPRQALVMGIHFHRSAISGIDDYLSG